MYDVHLRLIVKRVVDFLLVFNRQTPFSLQDHPAFNAAR